MLYHPLGATTSLYALWRWADPRGGLPTAIAPAVRARYQQHLTARLRRRGARPLAATGDAPDEDRRPLVADFQRFFPSFLAVNQAEPSRARIPIAFPSVPVFDAQAVEADDGRAIFVTSRVLDVVEAFARTLSLCACVNGQSIRELQAVGEPPSGIVLLAWLPFIDVGLPLAELRNLPPAGIRGHVLKTPDIPYAARRRAYQRRRLTHYLGHAMLLAVERMVRGTPAEANAFLEAVRPAPAFRSEPSLEAGYLATLVLTFIVLHEHAHLAHRHNSLEPMHEDPQIAGLIGGMQRFARDHPETIVPMETRAPTQRLEHDADCFPFEVVSGEYREPLLEAASLWLATLAGVDRGQQDWLHAAFASEGRAHPQYAMRVWFLNSRYSEGERQGEVARRVRHIAEAVEAQPSTVTWPAATWLPIVHELWRLAEAEVGAAAR